MVIAMVSHAEQFALIIRRIRQERGLSVKDVSRQLGITENALYKWEHASAQPSIDRIAELGQLYDVPVSALFGEDYEDPYYTSDEIMLINYYRMQSDEGKRLSLSCLRIFAGVDSVVDKDTLEQ